MSSDRTQHQSSDELRRSQELSLESSQPPALVPGYSLQHFLGSGTFGEVWSATDQKTGRRVAIKFYTRRSKTDVMLLAQEVEKLAVLAADRYVVQLLDVGWDSDPPYYVMDYVEHGSLEDKLKGGRTLAPSDAVELFQEIAIGMVHLHGKGVLHCDLKPGNVLLDQDGKPRVADFGQSRLHTDQTPSLGTLFFMAPEQADLNAIPDARWDVYGLGALLYSMLTGSPPYYCEKLVKEIESTRDVESRLKRYKSAINQAEKPTAHRKVDGVDRSLADIIDRCIDPNPKTRFSSVQSVLFSLQQRQLAKARHPLLVLGILGPLLLMAVMSYFGLRAYQRAVGDTNLAITKKAVESNDYAARYAARSATESISEYFRVVNELARSAEFKAAFTKVTTSDNELIELLKKLSDPNLNTSLATERRQFIENKLRIETLQPFLEERIQDKENIYPEAASWFVNDRAGTQIASVYTNETPITKVTLGKNYSYRTYFTGNDQDVLTIRPDGSRFRDVGNPPEDRDIIEAPHLSAVFLSEGSDTWKLAFSVPIEIGGEIQGIVALTVDVGHFVDFPNVNSRYAMLVDGRNGDNQGVILEHPLFDELVKNKTPLPYSLIRTVVDLDSIESGKDFRDPIGYDPAGKDFDKELVVAKAPVYRAANSGNRNEKGKARVPTGLVVLAVEDYQSVIQPVHLLGSRLGMLGLMAALFFLAVTIAMWLLVMRMLRDTRQRLSRLISPFGESASLEDMATIAAPTGAPGGIATTPIELPADPPLHDSRDAPTE